MRGRYTGCDLSDLSPLALPHGLPEKRPSPALAKLSLELAAASYDLDLDDWLGAGWTDVTIQVDNALLTGAGGGEGMRQSLKNGWVPYRARHLSARHNPLSQLRGALRQRSSPDTCKAVVMAHPFAGRTVIAVGFMGTGKRVYDWFSNFRVAQEEGLHSGFLRLAEQFENNAGRIRFPRTAFALDLPSLTLSDVLSDLCREDSRFLLFSAGHSQGGALMQVYLYRRIAQGAYRRNLLGFGFASPTVASSGLPDAMRSFPAFHLFNADDVFSRVGAQMHLGQCCLLPADDRFRAICYRGQWADVRFREVLRILRSVRGTEDALLLGLSLLRMMEGMESEGAESLISEIMPGKIPGIFADAAQGWAQHVIRYLIRHTEKAYRDASGCDADKETMARMSARLTPVIKRMGAAAFFRILGSAIGMPHTLKDGDAPYARIINYRFGDLRAVSACAGIPAWDARIRFCPRARRQHEPADRFRLLSTARKRR